MRLRQEATDAHLVSCSWLAAHELQCAAKHTFCVSCPVRFVCAASLYLWGVTTVGDKHDRNTLVGGTNRLCGFCHVATALQATHETDAAAADPTASGSSSDVR